MRQFRTKRLIAQHSSTEVADCFFVEDDRAVAVPSFAATMVARLAIRSYRLKIRFQVFFINLRSTSSIRRQRSSISPVRNRFF